MDKLSDAEFEAANERGRIEFETKPHAKSARYDRTSKLMTLELYDGCVFSFPPHKVQGLEGATDEQIEAVDLGFTGYGLHWEALDADITVPGLLNGRFGSEKFMSRYRAELRAIYDEMIRSGSPSTWDAEAAE